MNKEETKVVAEKEATEEKEENLQEKPVKTEVEPVEERRSEERRVGKEC